LRFLAAGYVIVVPTYRSRDVDPQSRQAFEDTLSVVEHVRKLAYVDPESIVVYGCSGGGDLALEVAAATRICAVVPEEPATVLMSGLFNAKVPKRGERHTPLDSFFILEDPTRYYTPEYQKIMRAKVARIQCPVLIVQGDEDRREVPINRFNAVVLIPELRAANKTFSVALYPGQNHCFCFLGGNDALRRPPEVGPPPASWPSAAQAASREIDMFCRRYLRTQPRQLDSGLVKYVEVNAA
jgi:dipeptidyl aminopeptidase/acylaminoacyl peptidase